MVNIKKWWSRLGFGSGLSPTAEVLPDTTDNEELRYWWLLPGYGTYYPASSMLRRGKKNLATVEVSGP